LHRHWDTCSLRESSPEAIRQVRPIDTGLAASDPRVAPVAAEPVIFPDVRYAKLDGVEPNLLSLDVHAPRDARGCPVLVYVHGGAWSFGDKRATGHKVPYFTGRGWVLVSLNYRLLPAADPLVQAQDVAGALTWVHDRIERYGGDPNQLFLMGHSAGAHLVSLVATDFGWLERSGKDPSIIRGVVQLDTAALDIVRLMETSADFYTRFFGDDHRQWRQASPVSHVAAGKPIPPFLLAVAGGHQATRLQVAGFAAALQQAGVRAEILEAADKTHTTLNRDLGLAGDAVTAQVMEFIDSIRTPRR
jgi:acetyl esterase/lipase